MELGAYSGSCPVAWCRNAGPRFGSRLIRMHAGQPEVEENVSLVTDLFFARFRNGNSEKLSSSERLTRPGGHPWALQHPPAVGAISVVTLEVPCGRNRGG
jgi:hypothetical protein